MSSATLDTPALSASALDTATLAAPCAPGSVGVEAALIPGTQSVTAPAVERADSISALARFADYIALTKPRISAMVLVTVWVAAFMAHWGPPPAWLLLHTLVGTALVAASASALNQRLERRTDSLMDRTADRPLPAGRLADREVFWFGVATIVVGLCYLTLAVNWQTAALGATTWLLYVVLYTPLKLRTPLNTVVGAVAGALPTLMGWTAVAGSFGFGPGGGGLRIATLFLIVYLWQFPHFMAIAWIYRRQYAAAGLKMLTVVDPSGRRAGTQAVAAALALVPVSLLPILQHAGPIYFAAAWGLGLVYLAFSIAFSISRDEASARRLLRVSLVYLPTLLILFMLAPLT